MSSNIRTEPGFLSIRLIRSLIFWRIESLTHVSQYSRLPHTLSTTKSLGLSKERHVSP